MTVYVDNLAAAPIATYHGDTRARRVGAKNGHRWAHMVTDGGEDELHAFARRIGMRRDWFQGDHYDLTPTRHALALAAGAKEITRRALVAILRSSRKESGR